MGAFGEEAGFGELFFDQMVYLLGRFGRYPLVENRHDNIAGLGNLILYLAHGFIQPAADTVADDGRFIDFLANNYRQAVCSTAVIMDVFNRKKRPADYLAFAINTRQGGLAPKPMLRRNHNCY